MVFFVEIASKLEKVGSTFPNFNPLPSLPSLATNDRKPDKQHNTEIYYIVLNNKLFSLNFL